jgi:hypothetical protein
MTHDVAPKAIKSSVQSFTVALFPIEYLSNSSFGRHLFGVDLMTPDNLQTAIRYFLGRRPFLPFVVELQSGHRYRVAHPEDCQLRGGMIHYTLGEGRICLFDHESVCMVSDIEDEPDLVLDLSDFTPQ